MFAIIQTGGKQYIVQEGQTLSVELLPTEVGGAMEFSALLVAESDGSRVDVGTPEVKGAIVKATIVEHGKGKKIDVMKYKPKVRYRRKYGHRQPFTKIKIEKINA